MAQELPIIYLYLLYFKKNYERDIKAFTLTKRASLLFSCKIDLISPHHNQFW